MKYNGHPSWACWNVYLWISNDEGLYRLAMDCIDRTKNRREAAKVFLGAMPKKTPDGARYNITNVMHALRSIQS